MIGCRCYVDISRIPLCFVQVFDKYVKERADEERKEKKAKAKEMKESFRLLCEEARVSSKTSYSDFTK
jgi:transcription elongation regulator 1